MLRLPGGVVERCAALGVLKVQLGAALDEGEDSLDLAEDAGVDQRRPAVLISLVDVYIGV